VSANLANSIEQKIVLPGGAGLVGQNLVVHLKRAGYTNLVILDKHRENLQILRGLHPDVIAIFADLAEPGAWDVHFDGAHAVVMLQAQIGHPDAGPFVRNNIDATRHILESIRRHDVPFTIHISSSVVESVANDHYTNTKKEQENMVIASGLPVVVLRPTLMFGWFDRKHLGWLARFMKKTPIFPIPGDGRFSRQPLYAGDFSRIILSCIQKRPSEIIYNISGRERIDYIDIIRAIKRLTSARTLLLKIPVGLFSLLLRAWALVDREPPFTADQLTALIADDEFELIDWPAIFDVRATALDAALNETFNDLTYSKVVLGF
jgi:nucleoside-diphosphate-sugar epimerase